MTKKQTPRKKDLSSPTPITTDWQSQVTSVAFLSRFAASAMVGLFAYMVMVKHLVALPPFLDALLALLFSGVLLFADKLKVQAKGAKKGKPTFSPLRLIALTILGALVFVYNFWFFKTAPIIVMPLVLAVVLRLLTPGLDQWISVALSSAATFFGCITASFIFSLENFQAFVSTWASTNPDVFFAVFQDAVTSMPFFAPSSLAPTPDSAQVLLLTIAMVGLAGLFAVLITYTEKSWQPLKQWLPHILIAIIALNFLVISAGSSEKLTSTLSMNPPNESYAYDAYVYLKTYYNMTGGENYYHALPDAVKGDKRVNDPTKEWLLGYITFRLPTVFYLWRIFAGSNGGNIYYLSLMLAVIALVLTFYGINRTAGAGVAGLSALLVAPYLYLGANWVNILFPDWWAALFGLIGVALFFQKQYIGAAAVVTLAALSREPMGVLIAAGLLAGIVTKERKIWLSFGIALISFLALYALHQYLVRTSIVLASGEGLSTFFVGWNMISVSLATNYLAYPITFLGISTILPFAAIVAAFYQKERVCRIFIASLMVGFVLYLLAARASSYQGQLFMPLVLVSLPFLLRPYLYEEKLAV